MLRIHQAIWGYSNGHRLLASSMPLSSQSIKILEPLSDLSGTEMFNKFDGYLTGCSLEADNCYALSKTWYASEMSRPGCAWTHTLLFAFRDEEDLQTVNIHDLFRRPCCTDEDWMAYFTKPIDVCLHDDHCKEVSCDIDVCATAVDVFSLLTQYLCPIVISVDDNLAYNKALELLLAKLGLYFFKDISFCTGAFSNRTINRTPLDLQIVPNSLPKVTFRSKQKNIFFADFPCVHKLNGVISELEGEVKAFYRVKSFILLFDKKYCNRRTWEPFEELCNLFFDVENFSVSSTMSILQKCFSVEDAGAILAKTFELLFLPSDFNNSQKAGARVQILFDFFTDKSLLLDNGDCISKEVLTKVLNYLWLNEHNKMLTLLLRLMQNDLNSVGEKAAKYIATLISIEDYSLLLSENPRVSVVMIRFNWRLALCNDIWKQSKNIQIEVLHELRSTVCKNELVESEYLDIIRGALINCKYDLTVEMYKTFGDVVIDVFFELGNSVNKSTNASLKRWSGLCAKNHRLSVSKLTRIEDATLFEVVIDVLDPYDDDLLQVAPTVWEQLYQKFCGISGAYSVRIKYAQFVLPIILRSDNCFADELVRFAFTTVHKILANDNMDYCRWEKLSELLPDVVWYNSWDKCKRLRKAARRKQYDVDFYA